MEEPKQSDEYESRSSMGSDRYGLLQEYSSERIILKSPNAKRTAIVHLVSWIVHATLLFTFLTVMSTRLHYSGDKSYRKSGNLHKRMLAIAVGADKTLKGPSSLQKVISLEERLFQLDVDVGNVYKSPPNPETDEAWANITSGSCH